MSVPLSDMTDITVDEYLGVPFAVPPVGQLRYADPVPLDRLPSGKLGKVTGADTPRDTLAPYSWPRSVSWCLAEGYRK